MNKTKKKKQVAAEKPLQEAPNPMCPCEPAAPPVETFEERVEGMVEGDPLHVA